MDFPENPPVSSTAPTPTGFYSQKLWGLIFLVLEPWAGWSGLGLGSLAPEVSLPIFSHHTWMWGCPSHISVPLSASPPHHISPRISMSPPFLSIWVNMSSFNPWLSDFHKAQFSYNSGWYLFCSLVVIFAIVVWGGKVYLPMPPSLPEVNKHF